jgi:hypothetical protein
MRLMIKPKKAKPNRRYPLCDKMRLLPIDFPFLLAYHFRDARDATARDLATIEYACVHFTRHSCPLRKYRLPGDTEYICHGRDVSANGGELPISMHARADWRRGPRDEAWPFFFFGGLERHGIFLLPLSFEGVTADQFDGNEL